MRQVMVAEFRKQLHVLEGMQQTRFRYIVTGDESRF
jgi:hypothetical protein